MVPPRQRLPTAERRLQIADAALDIIAESGLHRLTALEIADRVGVADGTLFRHFRDKQEIIGAAIERFEALLMDSFPEAGDDPLEDLRAFFVRRVALARRKPRILRLVFSDRLAEAAGEEHARRVQRIVEASLGFVRQNVERAQARGLIAPAVSSELLLWMITGVIRGAVLAARPDKRGGKRQPTPEKLWAELETVLRSSGSPKR